MAGVLKAAGRGLSGSEQVEGLHIYNAMLDGVKTERWFFYQILRGEFQTVSGQKEYTVGDAALGANWVVERPEKILSAGLLVPGSSEPNSSEIPVYVVQSYEEYQNIVCKGVQSSIALVLYYQAALPVGIATLWPVPSQIYTMVLYTPQTVQEFTDVEGDFIVPKGYREFLEYEGAVKVHQRHPELPPLRQDILVMARDYKARVEAQQFTPTFMRSDGAVLNREGTLGWAFNGRTLVP